MRRAALLAAAVGAAAAVAGCGSSPARDPADVLPASTTVVLRVQRGPALERAERLLGHVSEVPARVGAALAAVRLPRGTSPVTLARVGDGWVAVLRPADPKAYAKRLGPRPTARVRGWTVVGSTRGAVEAVRHAKLRLSARPAYRPPPDALAAAWATPAGARALALPPRRALRWAALTLTADTLTTQERAAPLGPGAPSDAAAATDGAAFAVGGGPWAPLGRVLPHLARAYGVDGSKLAARLAPGDAVVVRPGAALPELTLVGAAADAPTVAHAVGAILVGDATFAEAATVDGVPLERWILGAGEVDDGAWGDSWAASTGTAGVLAAHAGGADLGLPDRTEGWVFVDAAAARATAPALDALAGTTEATRALARLGPIRRLVGWAAYDRGVQSVTLRVG